MDAASSPVRTSEPVVPAPPASFSETVDETFDARAEAEGLAFEPLPVQRNGNAVTWFGRTVRGANLSANLSAAQSQLLVDGMYRYGLLHLPDQTLTPEDEIRIATLFDHDPESVVKGHPVKTVSRLPSPLNCVVLQGLGSVLDHHGIERRELEPFPTAQHMWHTDSMAQLRCPPMLGFFYCLQAPFGDARAADGRGATRFMCSQRVFDLMSDEDKELALRMRVKYTVTAALSHAQEGRPLVPLRRPDADVRWPEHPNDVIQVLAEAAPPKAPSEFTAQIDPENPVHPLIQAHPITGKLCFLGMPGKLENLVEIQVQDDGSTVELEWSKDDSNEFVARILRPCVRAEHIHAHTWSNRDCVLWDQRRLFHMNPPVEEYAPEPRVHHRIQLSCTAAMKPTGPVDRLCELAAATAGGGGSSSVAEASATTAAKL